jgi:Mn2+/Fe2+ NRAMP family transporter
MHDEPLVPFSRWRLPAVLRYLIAGLLGAVVAGLATYLVRSIGF